MLTTSSQFFRVHFFETIVQTFHFTRVIISIIIKSRKAKFFKPIVPSNPKVAPKHHKSSKQSKYKQSDRLSSINEKTKSMDSTSDEGFNSGGQTTTTNSPDMDRNGKKQRRRKQRRNRTESRAPSQSRTTSSKSSDEYLTRI
jgi:hypothetical protein